MVKIEIFGLDMKVSDSLVNQTPSNLSPYLQFIILLVDRSKIRR